MLWLFKDVKHFQGRGKDQVNGSLANQLPRFVVERSVIPIPFPHVSCWPACELYPTSYQANYLMKQLRGPSRAAETSNFQDTHPLFEPLSTGQLPKSHSAKTFIKTFSYTLFLTVRICSSPDFPHLPLGSCWSWSLTFLSACLGYWSHSFRF